MNNHTKKWKELGWHFTFANGHTASVIPEYNYLDAYPQLVAGEWEIMELESDSEPLRHCTDIEMLNELMRIALLA